VNEILINLNEKLISMCDVTEFITTCQSKVLDMFATHYLSFVGGIEQKLRQMFK